MTIPTEELEGLVRAATKGPWAIEEQPGDEWWFGNGEQIIVYPEGGKTYESFAVMGLSVGAAVEQERATARLIALTPNLAAEVLSLRAMLKRISSHVDLGSLSHEDRDFLLFDLTPIPDGKRGG